MIALANLPTHLFRSLLYMIIRAVGTVLVSMMIRAAWDWTFSVSATSDHAPKSSNEVAGNLIYAMIALFLISANCLFEKQNSNAIK
jgi:phosphate starvation-inducible membrane PsiE